MLGFCIWYNVLFYLLLINSRTQLSATKICVCMGWDSLTFESHQNSYQKLLTLHATPSAAQSIALKWNCQWIVLSIGFFLIMSQQPTSCIRIRALPVSLRQRLRHILRLTPTCHSFPLLTPTTTTLPPTRSPANARVNNFRTFVLRKPGLAAITPTLFSHTQVLL